MQIYVHSGICFSFDQAVVVVVLTGRPKSPEWIDMEPLDARQLGRRFVTDGARCVMAHLRLYIHTVMLAVSLTCISVGHWEPLAPSSVSSTYSTTSAFFPPSIKLFRIDYNKKKRVKKRVGFLWWSTTWLFIDYWKFHRKLDFFQIDIPKQHLEFLMTLPV